MNAPEPMRLVAACWPLLALVCCVLAVGSYSALPGVQAEPLWATRSGAPCLSGYFPAACKFSVGPLTDIHDHQVLSLALGSVILCWVAVFVSRHFHERRVGS